MTEAEWLVCDRPHRMLKHLRPWKPWGRKMCLYVCASCHRGSFLNHLNEPCLALLDMAVRYADRQVVPEEYKAAIQEVTKSNKRDKLASDENGPPSFGQALLDFLRFKHLPGWEGATEVEVFDYLGDVARQQRETMRKEGRAVITEEQAIQIQKEQVSFMKEHSNFLRDIFGNPFRKFTIDPTWLAWNDNRVVRLAQGIYQNQAFDRLPALAEALEEAGCLDPCILAHCRDSGDHVPGCWVVDLLLGND